MSSRTTSRLGLRAFFVAFFGPGLLALACTSSKPPAPSGPPPRAGELLTGDAEMGDFQ